MYRKMIAKTLMKCEAELCQRPAKIINFGENYMQSDTRLEKDFCLECYTRLTNKKAVKDGKRF